MSLANEENHVLLISYEPARHQRNEAKTTFKKIFHTAQIAIHCLCKWVYANECYSTFIQSTTVHTSQGK